MTDRLWEFVRARIDEDSSAAHLAMVEGGAQDFRQGALSEVSSAVAAHVARHDPARVLRDVEARRRVLERHVLSPAGGDPELPWDNRDDCQYDGEDWPCADLLDLALAYADHPEYRSEWDPESAV